MATPITSSNTRHSTYVYSQPLGVECCACGHRALAFADRVDEPRANIRELRTLRSACSACGSRDWQGWLLLDVYDLERFLARLPEERGPSFG